MDVKFKHWRVPTSPGLKKKGKPEEGTLFQYSREFGFADPELRKLQPYPKGGFTLCILKFHDANATVIGQAKCSMSDNFCYETGRELAFMRAAKLAMGNFAHDLKAEFDWVMEDEDAYIAGLV